MGGSAVHTKMCGVADLEVADDAECLRDRAPLPVVLPAAQQRARRRRGRPSDPVDRRGEELYDIVPTAPRRAYDMRKVDHAIVDDGDVLPMKPEWAKNVITGLARVGGQPVGIVANQPMVLGGALDVNSADKAARFVWLCDAFGIPLVFLHDVPGFIVGSAVEKQGIIRHGAKMLFAVSEATVPKISVVLRKSYGAGYFVMNGLAYEADYIVAWPTAEIAVMGPDGMVNIIIASSSRRSTTRRNAAQKRLELAEEIRENIDPYIAAGHGQLDDVIDPAETRAAIGRGLRHQRRQARRSPRAQARRPPRLTTNRFLRQNSRYMSAACRRNLSLASRRMAEIRAEITANVWQVVVDEGQMVAEGDEICILESMKMEIPVVDRDPRGRPRAARRGERTVQEGDLIAIIDES